MQLNLDFKRFLMYDYTTMSQAVIVVVIILIIGVYLWFLYNGLVTARVRIKEAWSQNEVQLKRQSSPIPNLH